MRKQLQSLARGVVLLLLTMGCGGTGGSAPAAKDGDTIHATFDRPLVELTIAEHQPPVTAYFTITLRPRLVTSVWITPVDPGNVLAPSSEIRLEDLGSGTYGVDVPLDTARAPGVYEGTLTMRLCKDASCAAEWALEGATIPYRITVTAVPSAVIQVDGAAAPDVLPSFTLNGARKYFVNGFRSGQTIGIQASEPVTWSQTSLNVTIEETSRTPTSYAAVVTANDIDEGGEAIIQGTTAAGKSFSVSVWAAH